MSPGPGVDATGTPVVDPTANVLDLVSAGNRRQDDLREMESKHVREVLNIREGHARELRPLYQRAMRHFECHVDGCTRIGFPVHGTGYRACHHEGHHPAVAHEPGEAVTPEHIAEAHADARRGRARP